MSGYRTVTYRFEEVPLRATKTVRCPDCGKKVRRQRTFGQTLNPYNRNAHGIPKNVREILAELRIEAEAWKTRPEQCAACFEAAAP